MAEKPNGSTTTTYGAREGTIEMVRATLRASAYSLRRAGLSREEVEDEFLGVLEDVLEGPSRVSEPTEAHAELDELMAEADATMREREQ
jgi:hypothetical protein